MKLADSLDVMVMLDPAGGGDRDRAIRLLLEGLTVHSLLEGGLVEDLLTTVVRRDELGPTGIGEGVAVPHAWHPGLTRMAVALGVSRVGIDYPSIDHEPVHLVLLVLTPPDRAFEPRKQALFGNWLHHLRDAAFRASLVLAADPEEIRSLLRKEDEAGA